MSVDPAKPVILTRKPRLYLVGNPSKLGFLEHEGPYGRKELIDADRVRWYAASITVSFLVFALEKPTGSLSIQWIGDNLYHAEFSGPSVTFSRDVWEKYSKLLIPLETYSKKPDPEDVKALFDYIPPIDTYRIPDPGTGERRIFNRMVALAMDDLERQNEFRSKVWAKLREVDALL